MPTYAYACTACEHRFDVQQSFADDALTVCPECDGRLRKVFASVGVVFKGSGFYRNDARAGAVTAGTTANPARKSDGAGTGSTSGSGDSAGSAGTPASPTTSGATSSSPSTSGSSTSGSTTAKATAGAAAS